jgi:hypothetical protein
MTTETTTRGIHAALIKAMHETAELGIGKTASANLGGASVKYRGIEQAMNTMVGVLVRCGITVVPRYADVQVIDRPRGDPKDGKFQRVAMLRGTFTFSAADGSSVQAECWGEAMDSGDKALVKAQSIAFRTALFQVFVVPTKATAIDPEDDGDDGADEPVAPAEAVAAANAGLAAYQAHFQALGAEGRKALAPFHDRLKKAAQDADANRAAKEGTPA